MDTQRLESLFWEAGIDLHTVQVPPSESLTELATSMLQLLDISMEELEKVRESLAGIPKTSALAVGIGVGLSAFTLANAAPFLDFAVDAGARVVNFLIDHHALITAGWDALAPPLLTMATEIVLHLPGGTIDLGLAFADATHIAHELVTAALSQGAHLGDIVHAMTAAAHAVDLAEIATTLGLSLALGWVAGKIVDTVYGPKIDAIKSQIYRIQEKQEGLERLKQALKLRLPPATVAQLLENVAPHHWEF